MQDPVGSDTSEPRVHGGRFDFDDGGTYCGNWEDGKAHGFGVCTGPKGMGEFAGTFSYGYETNGVYSWPSGNKYEGQWLQGKRHGIGIETKNKWIYRGEWTAGFKGRYGIRFSRTSNAKYEGTWTTGFQDGYGVESYNDGGTYCGQWLRGMRHGLGIRKSAQYGITCHYRASKNNKGSLTSLRSETEEDTIVKDRDKKLAETRGGFVLIARPEEDPDSESTRRLSAFLGTSRTSLGKKLSNTLRLRKQKSTGDLNLDPRRLNVKGRQHSSVRSNISNISTFSTESVQSGNTVGTMGRESNTSFFDRGENLDPTTTETYYGEWKNDKRCGFGVCERTDGLRYEGEWFNNKKHGYGITTMPNGHIEEGKYKNNLLISSQKKTNKFLVLRTSKLKERIETALLASEQAAKLALEKGDIAMARMANARAKSAQAEMAAEQANRDSMEARLRAKEYAPEFHQPGSGPAPVGGATNVVSTEVGPRPLPAHLMIQPQEQMIRAAAYEYPNVKTSPQPVPQISHIERSNQPTTSAAVASKKLPQQIQKASPAPPQFTFTDGEGETQAENTKTIPTASEEPVEKGKSHEETQQVFAQLRVDMQTNQMNGDVVAAEHAMMLGIDPRHHSRKGSKYDPKRSTDKLSDFLKNSSVIDDHFDYYGSNVHINTSPSSTLTRGGTARPQTLLSRAHQPLQQAVPNDYSIHQNRTLPSPSKTAQLSNTNPSPTAFATLPRSNHVASNYSKKSSLSSQSGDSYQSSPGGAAGRSVGGAQVSRRQSLPSGVKRPKLVKDSSADRSSKLSSSKDKNVEGSMPDIKDGVDASGLMRREEASKLGERQREINRRQRDLSERRQAGDLSVIFSDIKEWCHERQLVLIVIAINVCLAAMFFHLLAP